MNIPVRISWMKDTENPTFTELKWDRHWLPHVQAQGTAPGHQVLGDQAASAFLLYHPESTILVLMVQDVLWPWHQYTKKQNKGVGGRKQLLEACLCPIGQA